jgi:glucose/arabinose dehydrogenase
MHQDARFTGVAARAPRSVCTQTLTAAVVSVVALGTGTLVSAQTVSHQLIASGLVKPMQTESIPGESTRMCVVEQRGTIKLLKNGVLQTTPYLDIDALVPDQTYGGLFGMTFHPNYQQNGKFYVHHTTGTTSAITVWIAEYTRGSNPDVVDATTRRVILKLATPSAQGYHLGGSLAFGADGLLYIPLGDGGYTGDPGGPPRSQSTVGATALWGKVLRVDVDGDDFPSDAERNYRVPADNPFVGVAGEDEIFVRGLRNPFRASFDRTTGLLWIGDVGGTLREEVDTLNPLADAGANYGWNCAEGTACTTNANCTCGTALKAPVYDYTHSIGLSITGGAVYHGCSMPAFDGHYFFADYQNNKFFSATVTATNGLTTVVDRTTQFAGGTSTITSICAAADGELYITNHTAGTVRRLIQTPAPPDLNGNGIADACECTGDLIPDRIVDGADLGSMLSAWGPTSAGNPADIYANGVVNGSDLGLLLANWGRCGS